MGRTGFSSTYNSGATNYLERLSGFFVPPVTANYTFYLNGDDNADMVLSPDEFGANATITAYATTYSAIDNWYWRYNVSIRTAARRLVAGRKYYFAMRHWDGYGSDYVFAGVRVRIAPSPCPTLFQVLPVSPGRVIFTTRVSNCRMMLQPSRHVMLTTHRPGADLHPYWTC